MAPLFVILVLALGTLARAKQVFVSSAGGDFTGDCGQDASRACPSLAASLNVTQDGDEVLLLPGVYRGDDNTGLDVRWTALSIFGAAADASEVVVDCENRTRGLALLGPDILKRSHVEEAAISGFILANMTFRACVAEDKDVLEDTAAPAATTGGGLYMAAAASLELLRVVFQECRASSGGAVALHTASASSLVDCRFTGNVAATGGAVSQDGTGSVTIANCTFESNNANEGGAMHRTPGPGKAAASEAPSSFAISDSRFYQNSASSAGGALRLSSSSVRITSTTFEGNVVSGIGDEACFRSVDGCSGHGGAIQLETCDVVLESTAFLRNLVWSRQDEHATGGALGASGGSYLRMKHVSFVNNGARGIEDAAGAGGAVYLDNSQASMQFVEYRDNFAACEEPLSLPAGRGGAIVAIRGSEVNMTSCLCLQNRVTLGGSGGALWAEDASVVRVVASNFTENFATSSYVYGGFGGAIGAAASSIVLLSDSVFDGNSAIPCESLATNYSTRGMCLSGQGGAIYTQGARLRVVRCLFRQNLSKGGKFDDGGHGGAVRILGVASGLSVVSSEFLDSDFYRNSAEGSSDLTAYGTSGQGGAVSIRYAMPSFQNCSFLMNAATSGGFQAARGGAVTLFYSASAAATEDGQAVATFTNCTFALNEAAGHGQGLFHSGHGGALNVVASRVTIVDSTLISNIAGASQPSSIASFGGGMFVDLSSFVNVRTSRFAKNWARFGLGDEIATFAGSHWDASTGGNVAVELTACTISPAQGGEGAGAMDVLNRSGSERRSVLRPLLERLGSAGTTQAVEAWLHRRRRDVRGSAVQESEAPPTASPPSFSSPDFAAGLPDIPTLPFRVTLLLLGGVTILSDVLIDEPGEILVSNALGLALAFSGRSNRAAAPRSELVLLGDLTSLNATKILAIDGNITFAAVSQGGDTRRVAVAPPPPLLQLVAINASFYMNLDVSITERLFLSGARLFGGEDAVISHLEDLSAFPSLQASLRSGPTPILSVLGDLAFGLQGTADGLAPHERFVAALRGLTDLDSTASSLIISSRSAASFDGPDLHLLALAEFHLLDSATLRLNATTSIVGAPPISNASTEHVAVHIWGHVVPLRGNVQLRVSGGIHIHEPGTLLATFDPADKGMEALVVHGAAIFDGEVQVVLANASVILGSAFPVLRVVSPPGSSAPVPLRVAPTPGVSLATSIVASASQHDGFTQMMEVAAVDCASVHTYVNLTTLAASLSHVDPQAPCQVCLAFPGCSFCDGTCVDLDAPGSASDGASSSSYKQCFTKNCCPHGCYDHGDCLGDTCECTWQYSGGECRVLSTPASLLIAGGLSLALIVALSVAYYYYSARGRKEAVAETLEELRQNLLGGDGAGERSSMAGSWIQPFSVPKDYLADLQEGLVLKDVFVDWAEVRLSQKIGEGTYGVVYKAVWRKTVVAVKMIGKSHFFKVDEAGALTFRREAYLMTRLRHPNIVLIMGIVLLDDEMLVQAQGMDREVLEDFRPPGADASPTICMMTEYLARGSLADILAKVAAYRHRTAEPTPNPLTTPADLFWDYERMLFVAIQAARGMLYLHSRSPPIVHRDLKSSNLVVDENWTVKVTDFGMSRILPEDGVARASFSLRPPGEDGDEEGGVSASLLDGAAAPDFEMTTNVGTVAWAAPEMLVGAERQGAGYSLKVDAYSFGIVLWEMWELQAPWGVANRFDIADRVLAGHRPPLSADCPPAFRKLIERCWAQEPQGRPTFEDILGVLEGEQKRSKRRRR